LILEYLVFLIPNIAGFGDLNLPISIKILEYSESVSLEKE